MYKDSKIFSKAAFLSSESGKHLKSLLGNHLDILDGKPVQEAGDGFGQIDYEADDQSWKLYPVMPEWCVEDMQERLF